jgi:hypothetical protein
MTIVKKNLSVVVLSDLTGISLFYLFFMLFFLISGAFILNLTIQVALYARMYLMSVCKIVQRSHVITIKPSTCIHIYVHVQGRVYA